MSLASFEPEAFTSAPIPVEAVPVAIDEANPLHDQTDFIIRDTLTNLSGEVVITQRIIDFNRRAFGEDMAAERRTVEATAAGNAVEAARARDKAMTEAQKAYQQTVEEAKRVCDAAFEEAKGKYSLAISEITSTEKVDTERLEKAEIHGYAFIEACARIGGKGGKTSQAIDAYNEQHASLTLDIESATSELHLKEADIHEVDAKCERKKQERDELISQHTAALRMARKNQQEAQNILVALDKTRAADSERRRDIEEGPFPETPDDINRAMLIYTDEELVFGSQEQAMLRKVTALQDLATQLTAENLTRDTVIRRLRQEIEMLGAVSDQLKDEAEELRACLIGFYETKERLRAASSTLENLSDAIQAIARNGITAIDHIPHELQDLARFALDAEQARVAKDLDDEGVIDYSVALPNITHEVLSITMPTPIVAPAHSMSGVAIGTVMTGEDEREPVASEELTNRQKLENYEEQAAAMADWVGTHIGSFLPRADYVVPRGVATRGIHAEIRIKQ